MNCNSNRKKEMFHYIHIAPILSYPKSTYYIQEVFIYISYHSENHFIDYEVAGCCWDDKVQFVFQQTEGKNSCHYCRAAPVLSYPNSTYYKLESFSYTFNSHGEDYHSVNHFFSILKLQGNIRITLFNLLEWFSVCLNFQMLMILNMTPILTVATPKTENRK